MAKMEELISDLGNQGTADAASGGFQLPEPLSLVGMVLFSMLGMWAFKEGRREANIKQLLLGIALVGYPYFTPEPWQVWLIGIALSVAVFKVRE